VTESELLDEFVAPFIDEPDDWTDVLRRARRRLLRRRHVLVFAVAVAVLAAATAVAVPLLRTDGLKLPSGADRRNVRLVIQPRTGRVLIEAAGWKGHDGVCYLIAAHSAGCALRRAHKTVLLWTAGFVLPSGRRSSGLWGYTFDPRVAAARLYLTDHTYRRLPLHRIGGSLRVTFIGPAPFTGSVALRVSGARALRLYDRAGRRITLR
jgi:hypothetical protein